MQYQTERFRGEPPRPRFPWPARGSPLILLRSRLPHSPVRPQWRGAIAGPDERCRRLRYELCGRAAGTHGHACGASICRSRFAGSAPTDRRRRSVVQRERRDRTGWRRQPPRCPSAPTRTARTRAMRPLRYRWPPSSRRYYRGSLRPPRRRARRRRSGPSPQNCRCCGFRVGGRRRPRPGTG